MQQLTPFLWFTSQTEEAITFYTSIFSNSRIINIKRYSDDLFAGINGDMVGKVLNAEFELAGQHFMALDGGDVFKFTPAISFFVNCETEAEIDALWHALLTDGRALMPLQEYPFSPKFGWLEDRFGISWQLNLGARAQKITPFLMFVNEQSGNAEDAVNFYTSIFKNSDIESLKYNTTTAPHTIQLAIFQLKNTDIMASDSSMAHDFKFSGAISFYVTCDTQAEVDDVWDKLSAVPEAEQCGWLQDKYGISWQIVPKQFEAMMMDSDPEKVKRVFDAMMPMKKLDIGALTAAYEG